MSLTNKPHKGKDVHEVLARLKGVRRSPKGFVALCPAHSDRNRSLSISEGNDGKILIHCFAGCPTTTVMAAIDMTLADLFPKTGGWQETRPEKRHGANVGEPRKSKPPSALFDRWAKFAGKGLCRFPDRRQRLAQELTLPPAVFDALGVGFDFDNYNNPCWTFPEVDGDGKVIGIARRFPISGQNVSRANKTCIRGSRRGLSVPKNWDKGEGPIFLPEGASCTLALTAMGLSAVGRPNSTGGVEYASKLLARVQREIVVVGENDKAGPAGVMFASQLASAMGRSLLLAFPPKGFKDSRAWLNAQAPGLHKSTLDDPRLPVLGNQYRQGLLASAERIEPGNAKGVGRDFLYTSVRHTENLGQTPEVPLFFDVFRRCHRSHLHHMGHHDDNNKGSAVRPSCKRWNCTACAERRKQEWAKRIYLAFDSAKKTPPFLYVLPVLRAVAEAIKKGIRRQKGKFLSIRFGAVGSRALIVSTVEMRAGEKVAKNEAFDRAIEALGKVEICKGKPVSASRSWMPPIQKKSGKGMFSIGIVDCDDAQIRRGLRKGKLKYSIWKPHEEGAYDFGASWFYTPEMTVEDREKYLNRLFGRVLGMKSSGLEVEFVYEEEAV
jgi:hypothetical protein